MFRSSLIRSSGILCAAMFAASPAAALPVGVAPALLHVALCPSLTTAPEDGGDGHGFVPRLHEALQLPPSALFELEAWAAPEQVPGREGRLSVDTGVVTTTAEKGFDWHGYMRQNLHMLSWQHAYRVLFQGKTRAGLTTPLFARWEENIRAIRRRWGDGDSVWTNYVGHPMMGAVMGRFEVMDDRAHAGIEIGDDGYWHARGVTLLATAAASTQFEIGPFSEATIGLNPERQGLVDFVVTPVLGTGLLVAEDAIDQYVIARLESGRGRVSKRLLRVGLNPARALANLFALRAPWDRDSRAD
jgi:hypothetical protein